MTKMDRVEYEISITVNGIKISKVIIDSHYREKHEGSVTDEIILKLVQLLDGGDFEPEEVTETGFSYFKSDPLILDDKSYRLIWLLKDDEVYIGVVNCFRRKSI